MAGQFKGIVNLDIRDSQPDWSAFLTQKAPKDAPNVLVILYDDTGLAAWSPFGGRINMPTLQRLADNGLTCSQWHTTASPRRFPSPSPGAGRPGPRRLGSEASARFRSS